MEEVSNRTIAGLLVVAMVISLTGTFFSLSKLDMLQKDGGLTGFALNENATAQLEIGTVTSINFLVSSVNWLSGSVNASNNHFCNLTTLNYSSGAYTSACVGFAGTRPGQLVLKNDGNRHVSVTLNTNATAATWLGDSSGDLYFEAYNNNTNPCKLNRAGLNTQLNMSLVTLCGNFTFTAGEDQLNIPLKVKVPYNITPGVKSVRITAIATAV